MNTIFAAIYFKYLWTDPILIITQASETSVLKKTLSRNL